MKKKFPTTILYVSFFFQHSLSFAEDDIFLGQLNRRVDKIQKLKTSRSKGELSAEQRSEQKNDAFFKSIKGKISSREFALLEKEFQTIKSSSHSQIDMAYEKKMRKEIETIKEDEKIKWRKIYRPMIEMSKNTIESDASFLNSSKLTERSEEPASQGLSLEATREEMVAHPASELDLDKDLFVNGHSEEDKTTYEGEGLDLTPNYEDTLFVILSKAYKRNFKRLKILN